MNTLNKVLGVLMVMTFAVFALPSYGGATDKLYSIDVDVIGADANGTQLRATVLNASPLQGNSQFSFVDLSVNLSWTLNPAGPVVITRSDNSSTNGQPDFSVQSHLRISNLYPVKPQQSVTVTFYVNNLACGEGTWSVVATTGSNGGGDIFKVADESANDRLTTVQCGQLACDAQATVQYGTEIAVKRGPNSDGSGFLVPAACNAIDFIVTDTLATAHTAYVNWDVFNAPDGAFSYTFTANLPRPQTAWKDTDGVPFSEGGNPKSPAFLLVNANPALICNPVNSAGDFLPRLYARLAEPISATQTKFQVDPTGGVTRPALPFHAILNDERVLVTKWVDANNNVTVVRAQANTVAAAYPAGTPAMYTPLKVLPAKVGVYAGNTQVQVCLSPDSQNNGSGVYGGLGVYKWTAFTDPWFGGD